MHHKEEILTENHITPMVSEIHTIQSITEENSRLFMKSILYKEKRIQKSEFSRLCPETTKKFA
jgi:hypothetical protein